MQLVYDVLAWCRKYTAQLVLVCAVVAVSVLYLAASYRLTGTVYVSLIGTDGAMRAASFTLPATHPLTYHTFQSDPQKTLLSVVPAPQGDTAAFLTRAKGAPPQLLVGSADSVETAVVATGAVSEPRWSPEGSSIAFAERDSADTASVPEAWVVKRAVVQGDALTVGRGYEPYPSRSQRTFALTSEGIVLLSYSDAPPTVVLRSPVPVSLSTPFTVSQDGTRIAWVAPADKSLQVFEDRGGHFVPLALEKTFVPQTMTFSPDGEYLLGTTHTEATTTVSVFTVSTGRVRTVGDFSGFMRLLTWTYE